MKKIKADFLFPLIALAILIFALSTQIFNVPPLGKLLNPFTGVIQNDKETALSAARITIDDAGLSDTVQVFFDDRKVPHIYARNTEDLYFAQGYVSASLRLWQMDFLSYVSAGRLSEILTGSRFLDYDRNQRRIGIPEAARRSLAMIEQDSITNQALTAYTKGVNAYISRLGYGDFPLEYKLLNYSPEPWTKLKSVLLLKQLGNTLAGYEEDMIMSELVLVLGEETFNNLYPDFQPHMTPVMNRAGQELSAAFGPVKKPAYLDYSFLNASTTIAQNQYNPHLGSNSWAVSGKRTKSGFPILASDPHLNLSFPCVWLEMQLSSPGMNVYGVTIPGTPAIIIGFNEHIAWGITNGADDVKDWYKLRVTEDYRQYELDGKWIPLSYRVEKIGRRGGKPFYDTIYNTVQGPVVTTAGFSEKRPELMNYALRWTLHNPSNEFRSFLDLNRATNYKEYAAAIRYYACPVMNFTFACKDNTIAVNHQGNLPLKAPGQGRFIQDGTNSTQVYTGLIPADSLPHELNPADGYVISANQHPTGAGYRYYYNGYYAETRANRIKELLDKETSLDIPKMEKIQLDNTNSFAVEALPVFLNNIDSRRLSKPVLQALTALSAWKGNYDAKEKSARLFELWLKNIKEYTWDELKNYPFPLKQPADYTLLSLIRNDPFNRFFDRVGTSEKEHAADIITTAFEAAFFTYEDEKKNGSVEWSQENKVNIMHMMEISAFSIMNLPSAGHPQAINATSRSWGPSWRMIVELGDRPRAYGVYPGGQSGNAGSRYYDSFVTTWNQGKYYPLQFFLSAAEAEKHTYTRWVMNQVSARKITL
ncbi:penicillin acylase family protein [Chitinophaga tropicalis]|uniref:Penicillin acylase family protein n=1 Tax=Chitinophaga tropicalis TaxID=2683588 RepID=A0A7K1UAM8_9BACT|nr:penicillin acylase family protein [Chitinophaga tropicalis]MVT11427.1 penicillin acylase family protein [Chitinophaga tropicalis]